MNIDERRRLGRTLLLASGTATLVDKGLNRILGEKLLSVRMLCVTSCFSLAGFIYWNEWLIYRLHMFGRFVGTPFDVLGSMWRFSHTDVVLFSALLLAGLCTSIFRGRWAVILASVVIVFSISVWGSFSLSHPRWFQGLFGERPLVRTAALLFSIASDISSLQAVRWGLRWLIRKPGFKSFVLSFIMQGVVFAILVVYPWWVGTPNLRPRVVNRSDTQIQFEARYYISPMVELVGLNASTGLFCVSYLIVLLFLILHQLAWPVAGRLVYPIQRFQLVTNRKLMAAVGIACLGIVSPFLAALLRKASGWFH